MRLAYKNLLNDKTRLILTVSGVALAVMLILLLNGFLTGMNHQITSYLDNSPGTIVVAQSGVSNLLGATSLLPTSIVEQAEEIEAVTQVLPIQSLFVILELHDKKQPAYLIGYEPELGGGPWRMAEGRSIVNRNEVVLDSTLAKRHNVGVGESLQIMGSDFSVVGLSSDTTSWMTSYFFIRKDAAETLLLSPGATSFLLVTAADERLH
jgi:putative ABC transport system permease protein